MSGASATTARGDGSPQRPKQLHRRTRTGCERCRAKRRKCDEGKPRCRRCTNAGAVCKYVAHISFQDKNTRKLSDNVASRIQIPSKGAEYPVLEFIVDNGSSAQSRVSGTLSTFSSSNSTEKPQDQTIHFDTVPELQSTSLAGDSQYQPKGLRQHPQRKDVDNPNLREPRNIQTISHENPFYDASRGPTNRETHDRWPLAGRSSLSDDEIDLLKCYSHHVAPWLDVYDKGQTFRDTVTRVAMTSPCVLEEILKLAAAFSGRPVEMVERRGVGILHFQAMSCPPGSEPPFSELRIMVAFVLVRTLPFVEAVPDTWQPSFHGGGPPFGFSKVKFADPIQRQTWHSSLVLLWRLVSQFSQQISSRPKTNEEGVDQSQRILDASINCLQLLVDVMNLCLPTPDVEAGLSTTQAASVSAIAGASRATQWRKLLSELSAWQASRPPELQPLVDVDGRGAALFPVIVFSGGAGIAANMLCHTAAFLLLGSRPRSVSPAERHGQDDTAAPRQSPLWHARRVCGIAVHSDPEHSRCWDPCMLAAFSLVARRMTHPAQQEEIIACLGRVRAAGWQIDGLVRRLREEWGFMS